MFKRSFSRRKTQGSQGSSQGVSHGSSHGSSHRGAQSSRRTTSRGFSQHRGQTAHGFSQSSSQETGQKQRPFRRNAHKDSSTGHKEQETRFFESSQRRPDARRSFGVDRNQSADDRGRFKQDRPKQHTPKRVWKTNTPFAQAAMKPGRRKQTKNRALDTSLFVRNAVVREKATPFHPKHHFGDFNFHHALKLAIAKRGYDKPTPIQDGAIPHALEGRDVIGIANTGTGKTAAFLLPIINKIIAKRSERALIITPTRELALQIERELRAFSRGVSMTSVLAIGGVRIDRQARDAKHANVIIGTPGRLKDLIDQKFLSLDQCGTVVLDEVDRMLDMGFINDIRQLLNCLPEERQSLFFSATLERNIRDLAMKFLKDPVTVAIAASRATSENVEQNVVHVDQQEKKIEVLHEMLLKPEYAKTLIFVRTKHGAEKLAKQLHMRGFVAGSIHGNLSQGQRKRAMDAFRQGILKVLVATDVAARGLDIDGITHVINYDIPATYEDYIHRIGRTGRADQTGNAVTFVDRFEK